MTDTEVTGSIIYDLVKSNKNFTEIDKVCEKYKLDSSFVYKICIDASGMITKNSESKIYLKDFKTIEQELNKMEKKWIVVMQKMDDTDTNESRNDVKDKRFAKFRADKLKVVNILDVNNPTITKKAIVNTYNHDDEFLLVTSYEVGKIVVPHEFDRDDDMICSGGIHYFRTLIAAYFYRENPIDFTGRWFEFYDNGIAIMLACENGKVLRLAFPKDFETEKLKHMMENNDTKNLTQ